MVTRVGIVGLGLIGGSLALRLVESGCEVSAWNHTPRPYAAARCAGIRCMDSLEELALQTPDVLLLCNPLRAMPEVLASLSRVLDRDATTLTDVGSVKGMVRRQVAEAGLASCYVGAHPMAGNERSGFSAADARLFDQALWVLTVDGTTSFARFLAVARLVLHGVEDRIIVVDDALHDRSAAMISHMPHVVATAMIDELTASPERCVAAAMSAGSWRDMTRVALTDPQRTKAMVVEDSRNVVGLLRRMSRRLDEAADLLEAGDESGIEGFFAFGQPYRDYRASLAHEADPAEFVLQTAQVRSGEWRRLLRASAVRGERIVDITPDLRIVAQQRDFSAHPVCGVSPRGL